MDKRNHVGQLRFYLRLTDAEFSSKKDFSLGRFYSPGEILFAMGDKIYPWIFNLGRYISLFHNHVVSLWLVVYLGRMI